jgi:hypothetical protein
MDGRLRHSFYFIRPDVFVDLGSFFLVDFRCQDYFS